jgi:manganese transport protein
MDDRLTTSAQQTLSGQGRFWSIKRILPFLGPAFVASIAYMDPGNFATNIQGGAKFGYMLLWVVASSNIMAMIIQALSAKLGIASGRNLAELCRERLPQWLTFLMWIIMEIVAIATDLAEFVGAAVGFYLLFGLPLWISGIITAFITFAILAFQRRGFRPLEIIITAFVGLIGICYLVEMILVKPDIGGILTGTFVPRFAGPESVVLAVGILGATVMPHVIYLHSSLTQGRIAVKDSSQLKMLFRFEMLDVIIAMGAAGLINAAMLIMAATTFHQTGLSDVGTIEEAHHTLAPLLGTLSSFVFAISLLASGISSSTVGTMAGQVIMQGFIKKRIPIWLRRALTVIPSLVILIIGVEPTKALVFSQVILSFGLPFAVVPLVMFTRNKNIMGVLVNKKFTTVIASVIALLIIVLNLYLLYQTLFTG